MQYKIVIPARFASTRLPGKPLMKIAGKPMIWHTYQRALETLIGNKNIIIATDHAETGHIASDFGANVVMTSSEHESGTSRLAEVARRLSWDENTIVVNLQGDEPLLEPELIELTAKTLSDHPKAGMATLGCQIKQQEDLLNPNCVKVVCDRNGKAIYFSRSAIPFARDGFEQAHFNTPSNPWRRHIGMYAYRVSALYQYQSWPSSVLEELEKLEQLRAIFNDVHIQVALIDKAPRHGVDTFDDLEKVRSIVTQSNLQEQGHQDKLQQAQL
ncbi:3-deoxy-manno-octulosonate cytidylyltransferase [uncultured Shewanella sp.]|uniref:3-deoxy-manno-octulosonate cytidylyltransferase n=1 Tax=uncultured Shewanella sp. TaxID=173975 RepID=UPI00262A2A8A|nr:3-deoxy-manno-octulosonate cytidylyltransferase [uncultured Shewanella sp.]